MSSTKFSPFQRHLLWYAESKPPHRITILSALRGSLRIGFNFPYSLLLSFLIRITYSPDLIPVRPFPVSSVPPSRSRTQLENITLKDSSYTQADLQALYDARTRGTPRNLYHQTLDKLHIWGWWAAAADIKTGRIDRADVERFQDGKWQSAISERRKSRSPGKGEVLPFVRGGPLSVAGHSWAVRRFFDVDVYRS